MGGSPYTNIYTQYYQTSATRRRSHEPKEAIGGVWDDETNAVPTSPTDAQVAAESLLGVSHFGYNANGSYIVATPTGHSSSGFGTQWCAYHSDTFSAATWSRTRTFPTCPTPAQNCGANIISAPSDESGTDEGVTIVEGHEYGESVTDPNPGSRLVQRPARRNRRCVRLDQHPERPVRQEDVHGPADVQQRDGVLRTLVLRHPRTLA